MRVCDYCGAKFTRGQQCRDVRLSDREFCSWDCADIALTLIPQPTERERLIREKEWAEGQLRGWKNACLDAQARLRKVRAALDEPIVRAL